MENKSGTVSSKGNCIEEMDPMVKITAVFSLGLSSLIFPNSYLGFAIVVLLFFVAALGGIIKSYAKIMFGFGIPITVMLLFIQGGYSPKNETIIANIGFLHIGLEGTLYALKIISTLLVFLGTFYIMNKTTYTGKLVASLTASGLSPKAGYLVLASLNVVPQMQRRMGVVQEAQSARGVETGGSMLSRLKAYIPLLTPVIMSSLTDAQERGMTLETRGFGIKDVKHTTYVELIVRKLDRVLKVLLLIFFVVVLIVSVLMRLGYI